MVCLFTSLVSFACSMWERMMIERAIEKKYLEFYRTIGSDYTNSKYLLKLEAEMMALVKEVSERFEEIDWQASSLQLRDFRNAQAWEGVDYTKRYMEKMEEVMDSHKEFPGQENYGERNWMDDMLEWEGDPAENAEFQAKEAAEERERVRIDSELDTWNEWYDVQVAQELGMMLDVGEIRNEDEIHPGALRLAENRVAKRLHASRPEWKEWKYRPQYTLKENMGLPPDAQRSSEEDSGLGKPEPTEGAKIIERILATDQLVAASKKWKARMAPRLADVDKYENETQAGGIMSHVDAKGNYVPPQIAASGSGTPLVDSVHGEGSVLANYDPSLSTAGHKLMDPANVADRRAMIARMTGEIDQVDEYIRREVEDPMLELLNEHVRGNLNRKSAKELSEDDESASNAFSSLDPKLGFEDDDFRLYDPVLTKASQDKKQGKPGDEEESDPNKPLSESMNEEAARLKREGDDFLTDDDKDPAMWAKWQDREYRRSNFLDLDPFGPANTDERRDFDDAYFHLDEEDYAYKNRVDPETDHQKPLTSVS
jgi:hypothetical protein